MLLPTGEPESTMKPCFAYRLLILAACFAFLVPSAEAQHIDLVPPPEGKFILDNADLIDPADKDAIEALAGAVLQEKAIPILVVTVESMAAYGGAGLRIETFATLLYNQWEIGHERINDQYWNKGILLLVSRDDRHARIELGDGWGREQDGTAREIMDERIIPNFKQGNFSAGILSGVEALDAVARGAELPKAPINWTQVAIGAAFIGLAIFTIVSLIRRRSSGWAWLFWGAVFAILGMVLMNAMRSSGGGGFSGGSFGGGFSGGGGATGSW